MFAFVWLPRDELTTRRRVAIGEMIEQAAERPDHQLVGRARRRRPRAGPLHARRRRRRRRRPTSPRSTAQLDEMVRGWEPSVEEALGELVGAGARDPPRAHLCSTTFPKAYRVAHRRAEAAAGHRLRICALDGDRAARRPALPRATSDGPRPAAPQDLPARRTHPAVRRGAGVREFRLPRARGDADPARRAASSAMSTNSLLDDRAAATADAGAGARRGGRARRSPRCSKARPRTTPFNQLIVAAGLEPRDVVLFRAWFRYLRQTGLSYRMVTVVEALRRAPDVDHGPDRPVRRDARSRRSRARARRRSQAAERAIDDGLAEVAAIDEDRILRLIRGVIAGDPAHQRLRARRRARRSPSSSIQRSVPGLPAPRAVARDLGLFARGVEGIHLRGGPIARGGLRWSDRRDDFRTEILGLMKAQLVKNAVIVPTGAKGGFYPKQLPPAVRPRRLARRRHRKPTASSSAPCSRSPTISSRARSSIPTR